MVSHYQACMSHTATCVCEYECMCVCERVCVCVNVSAFVCICLRSPSNHSFYRQITSYGKSVHVGDHRAELEITGRHRPFSVHFSHIMTNQILISGGDHCPKAPLVALL